MNKNITVLIIDDEKDIRRILEYELKMYGFNVYSASNGQAGLKIATEIKPDVILLDWVMPKMDGLKVLSKIRHDERTKDIIVLMLTAKNMMDDVETSLANGADDYIPKPFEGAELGPRIMSILGVLREQKGDRSAPQKLIQSLREDNRQ
jgi:DNA-binding response OmpR family regulator